MATSTAPAAPANPLDDMMVLDLPGGVTIMIAQPGQQLPTDDDLRKLYGVRDRSQIVKLSQSRARRATDAEKVAARVGAAQAASPTSSETVLQARLAELEKVLAAHGIVAGAEDSSGGK